MSFFSAICEPLILKTQLSWKDVTLGVMALVGILFIYISLPDSTASGDIDYGKAIGVGPFSAFLGANFTLFNEKYIQDSMSHIVVSARNGHGKQSSDHCDPCNEVF